MKAVEVFALPEYKLQVRFEDEVAGIIDLKPLVQKGIFTVLQNERLFAEVKFNQLAIFWSEELEIDLLNVYLELSGKSLDELFPKTIIH